MSNKDGMVVPENWKVKKIKDIAPLQRGFDLPNRKLQEGIYPVVYSNGIVNYHKRSIRLKGYDYTQAGAYYITICTQGKGVFIWGDCRRGNVVE